MEDWSILSSHVKYVKHDDGLETFHKLNINTLNYCQYKDLYQKLKGKEILMVDVDFGNNPEKLKSEYLDVYEGVYAEIISTNMLPNESMHKLHASCSPMVHMMYVNYAFCIIFEWYFVLIFVFVSCINFITFWNQYTDSIVK